jgi:hypothetical protein
LIHDSWKLSGVAARAGALGTIIQPAEAVADRPASLRNARRFTAAE